MFTLKVFFEPDFNTGKISSGRKRSASEIRMLCFPIFSLLSAMNVKTLDYFSLDVEGHEYQVLRTILPSIKSTSRSWSSTLLTRMAQKLST
jgi:hypothetical protein